MKVMRRWKLLEFVLGSNCGLRGRARIRVRGGDQGSRDMVTVETSDGKVALRFYLWGLSKQRDHRPASLEHMMIMSRRERGCRRVRVGPPVVERTKRTLKIMEMLGKRRIARSPGHPKQTLVQSEKLSLPGGIYDKTWTSHTNFDGSRFSGVVFPCGKRSGHYR